MSASSVGIVGLGIMGSSYARHAREAGHAVVGYDIAKPALDALSALGGRLAASPREVAAQSDIILMALPSVESLRAACLDGKDGVLAGAAAGTILVEMSTLPVAAKEECRSALAASGIDMLDCPVSGTGAQAAQRDIVLYASGDPAVTERARPVLQAIAREVRHVGAFGAGMKLKCVANLLVTIHNLASAEAMLLAEASGLDLAVVYDAIRSGAGNSRIFELRAPMMIEGRYEPPTMKMGVHMKDLVLILDAARDVACPTPLLTASLPFYTAALAAGRAGQDTAALFAVLHDMMGQG
jgi:putative dehydrogenase